jgi:protein-S-isoprenylcysteine O-methyltransferase Ste14
MSPWIAKAVVFAATVVMIAIRAPHGQRSRGVKTLRSYKGPLEVFLLAFAWVAFFVTVVWLVSPAFWFAEYPLHIGPLAAGVACFAAGLWLFHRSHADLGTNWSITLELREQHQLVTQGVYSRIRHPMYSGLILYTAGQALVLPNWVAGPLYLVSMVVLFAFRYRAEERMMHAQFGDEYVAYMARTKRLIPGVW